MRGILKCDADVIAVVRFTPAHAGNTQRTLRHQSKGLVHPRRSGEDSSLSSFSYSRVTPPRACGEYMLLFPSWHRIIGPPPLGRGMRQTKLHHGKSTWSTPTCVGKTSCHQQNEARPPGHPHVLGEDKITTNSELDNLRTPPLGRGIKSSARTG